MTILFGAEVGDEIHDGDRPGRIIAMEAGKLVVQWQGEAIYDRVPAFSAPFMVSPETLRMRRLRKLGLVG